ncbi:hypothetical protein F2P79_025270 [Pimephales promelas]|nr:hypothetical protein F2P79_025270 [Pimephales promelas]
MPRHLPRRPPPTPPQPQQEDGDAPLPPQQEDGDAPLPPQQEDGDEELCNTRTLGRTCMGESGCHFTTLDVFPHVHRRATSVALRPPSTKASNDNLNGFYDEVVNQIKAVSKPKLAQSFAVYPDITQNWAKTTP